MSGEPELTPLDALIGANAKRIRRDKGITQEAAAAVLDCSPSQISMLERGERAWKTRWIYHLSELYNVPPAEFFGAVVLSEEDKRIHDAMKSVLSLKDQDSRLKPPPKKKKN